MLGDDLNLNEAIAQYHKDNYAAVEISEGHKFLLSNIGCVGESEFVDAKSGNSYKVDFEKLCATLFEEYNENQSSINNEERRKAETDFENYVNERYPAGLCAVYLKNKQLTVILCSTKYNPKNFWNGRWKSTFNINLDRKTFEGFINIHVHYYEDGNVQMELNKNHKDNFENFSELTKHALKLENEIQNGINQVYDELGECTFKSLRRQLPMTKTKIDWNKIFAYKLGNEIYHK